MDYKRVLMLRFTNGMSSREIAETMSYPLPEEVTNEFTGPTCV